MSARGVAAREPPRQVASLLTEEPDPTHLSRPGVRGIDRRKYYSYYDRDLVVMDWDAALIVDEPRYFDETLYIMELANLQLAELEAYDRILDEAVERAYRDLAARRFAVDGRGRAARPARDPRSTWRACRDELSNITKFFGDWHLARIYQGLASRFHLADWHKTIDEKLKTLDDMYQHPAARPEQPLDARAGGDDRAAVRHRHRVHRAGAGEVSLTAAASP